MAPGGEKSRSPPPGIELIRALRGRDATHCTYRTFVLIINFNAYASYHASHKPNSIVKSVLDPDNTSNNLPNGISDHSQSWLLNIIFVKNPTNSNKEAYSSSKGWASFNGKDGTSLLGEIDVAFLSVHSMGMYFVGHLGDRVDLRVFLTVGMVCSGLFVALFGMGYFWNIHNFYYYLIMQMVAGMFQATGWHSIVAVVGNWFGKRKRGLIMGIWNAHTSIAIGGEYLYVASSGNLSTLFDLGGVVGGILAGRMSDRLDARAITVAIFMYCAIPTLILYRVYGADLGTHSSLKGNSRALATVTAIKDGTGSVGAALGPLLTGFISTHGWNGVFIMLTLSSLIFGLLSRMVVAEIVEKIAKAKERSRQQEIAGSIIQPLLIERH